MTIIMMRNGSVRIVPNGTMPWLFFPCSLRLPPWNMTRKDSVWNFLRSWVFQIYRAKALIPKGSNKAGNYKAVKVKAKGKGSCTIQIYAQNGVGKALKVKVK